MGDESQEVLMLQQAAPQIQMVVLRLARDHRLAQERSGQMICFVQQSLDCRAIERVAHDEKTVVGKRAALFGRERYEVHQLLFLITQQCCISSFAGGRIVACGNSERMYSTV